MLERPYDKKLKDLREGLMIDFEGGILRPTGEELKEGVTYYAARNTEHLYTVLRIDRDMGWVVPEEGGYPYDLHECIPVTIF